MGSAYKLTGRKFGRLTAIRIVGSYDSSGAKIWECKCDCGTTTQVEASKLVNGRILSCRPCGYERQRHPKHTR